MFNLNQPQQQQNQGGGLFGSTNLGLTGNPNPMNQGNPGQQGGQLWGNQPSMGMTNQNPNIGTKSLFGQPSGMSTGMTSSTGGGLFGQNQPPQQQTGGLFGSTGTGMGTSGLFGGVQQTGAIPMGGGSTVGSIGGGLFGQQQPQQPQQTVQTGFGGFGQQQAQQPQQFGQGQGLLGQGLQGQQGQQQGQGLFGQGMGQQQMGQQQMGQQQMGQPQLPQTGGLFGSTGFGQGMGMNQPQQQQGMMGLGGQQGPFGTMQQPTTQQPGMISSSIFGGTGTGMMRTET